MLFKSSGPLRYSENPYKLIVEIDPGIFKFYRALIPKAIKPNYQRYDPHVSIIRKEIPPDLAAWGKYKDKEVSFQYENVIQFGELYVWVNVFSKDFEEIRLELGLPKSRFPDGLFHITLGNLKDLDN